MLKYIIIISLSFSSCVSLKPDVRFADDFEDNPIRALALPAECTSSEGKCHVVNVNGIDSFIKTELEVDGYSFIDAYQRFRRR